MPLPNLHHFLICAVSFLVEHPLAGCVPLCSPLISDGNIILYFCLFDLYPLSQECKHGVKQELGLLSIRSNMGQGASLFIVFTHY
jgi:hypothetical protein